ncbi:hypothetical protein [Paraflavitalea speifideaquila]|uniref:hypothetical protein n=1 Tax=Paraflavitalea speifideaquila TaxID=3076558 RepID=UPI0028E8FA5C|nr:hypothetical protein [Paraflavitalea speifideiaquila]
MIDAAAVEVLDSYSCNGNNYWTYQKCKEWWEQKPRLLANLDNKDDIQYIDYLNGPTETDLRKYCYFLENGVYPTDETKSLTEL